MLAISLKKNLNPFFDFFGRFLSDTSYEDFVEGIKPTTKDGNITYRIEEGIFKQICQAASSAFEEYYQTMVSANTTISPTLLNSILQKTPKYVLIIDEINRGNIAGIFGELITLLEADKRKFMPEAMQTILPYSKESFGVPPNLHLIGTMNTSGRNTTTLDAALRRRFEFKQFPPQPELLSHPMEAGVDLVKLLTTLNQRILLLLGENYQIGHAYFMSVRTLDDLCTLFSNNIIPLLRDHFLNNWQKVAMVIGPQFFEQVPPPDYTLLAPIEDPLLDLPIPKTTYNLKAATDWQEADFIRIYDNEYGH